MTRVYKGTKGRQRYMYVHRDRLPHLLRHGQSYMHTLGPIAGDILAIYLNPPLRILCAGPGFQSEAIKCKYEYTMASPVSTPTALCPL